eukprot:3766667-Amphidinium_carterae.1
MLHIVSSDSGSWRQLDSLLKIPTAGNAQIRIMCANMKHLVGPNSWVSMPDRLFFRRCKCTMRRKTECSPTQKLEVGATGGAHRGLVCIAGDGGLEC